MRVHGWGRWLLLCAVVACEKTGDCPVADRWTGEVADHRADGRLVDGSEGTIPDGDTGTDVPPSDVAEGTILDAETGEIPPLAQCQRCLAPGLCFRFNKIEVTEPSEPEGLPAFLNWIWTPDVNAYRLNILFCVDDVIPEGSGVVTLKVTAGAAWHDLTMEQVLPVEHSNMPSWFEFVQGFTTTFTAEVGPDCTFRTVGPADLWFHPGPVDHALVCSAGDPAIGLPLDTIPIENLVARGHFDDACTLITDGLLEGCIADAAACQICSFILAPNYAQWVKEPDASVVNVKPCESSYCKRHCGSPSLWANFGGFVQGLGVPLACDTDGNGTNDGYKLAGNWEAGRVTYKHQ